ncbi:unnamed protein product [Schistosoma margrebowiei]|uniref:Uncharacterized protein n=1 Tax=Schistosoma margrebowiei TaxID=48269 RepID=A0A183MQ27_9TREM|nr:unnamed protein product [Schistosoma margrebowiei]
MWQEARKQEKHIKTLMVDYKRRAERRRDYYERIKQDPIKFLRLFGRSSKLHLDSEVTKAAENPNNIFVCQVTPLAFMQFFSKLSTWACRLRSLFPDTLCCAILN